MQLYLNGLNHPRVPLVSTITELSHLKVRRNLVTGTTGIVGADIADTVTELGAELVLAVRLGSDLDSLTAHLTAQWRRNRAPLL